MKRSCLVLLLGTTLASPATAMEIVDGAFAIGGFGGLAGGVTDGNRYLVGDPDGATQDAQLSIALFARPVDRLSVAGQLFFYLRGEEQGATLDWAFAEWRFSDALRLRAGRMKLPFGLSGELLDVGTVRPMFYLPQSVYGPAGLYSEAYQGAGLTGRVDLQGGAAFEYDLVAGHLELEERSAFGLVQPGIALESERGVRAIVGRVAALPTERVRVMLSGWVGQPLPEAEEEVAAAELPAVEGEAAEEEVAALAVVGAAAEWTPGDFALRAEYFRRFEGEARTDDAAYLEASWHATDQLELVARGELSLTRLQEVEEDEPLLQHKEGAVGVAWWFDPSFVVKASYHLVDGNRFAFADDAAERREDDALDARTQLFVLGTQFSF